MGAIKLRRTGLTLLLAFGASATLPLTSLGGDVAALHTYQARRLQASLAANPVSYGADGRLTLLVLGSDWRANLPGERLDAIMVITIDPVTKRVAAASIPRDSVYIPRAAANGGGTSGVNRINSLYSVYYRRSNLKHSGVDVPALKRFKADVATALATEIDYVAMVRFDGFDKLLSVIGGVDVTIGKAVRDSFYRAPGEHGPTRGVYFPKSPLWHLAGQVNCLPYPNRCHNGQAYARSRHGTVGNEYNSDFQRAQRQQSVAKAAADRIVQNGSGSLPSLVSAVSGRVYTDLPRTLDAANQLYDLVSGAHLSAADSVVFAPNKWATSDASTPLYTFRLKLKLVRSWINQHFGS